MTRRLLALAMLFCACQSTFAEIAEKKSTAADELYRQIGGPLVSKFRDGSRTLSENERVLVIEKLRNEMEKMRRESPKHFEDESQYIVLDMAILGDDRSLKQYVDWYVKHDARGQGLMLAITNAKVIPLLGEALFLEKKGSFNGHLFISSPQWSVAEVILHNLGNSAEFSRDVKNWVQRIDRRNSNTINILRDWYRANEANLKAGDFRSVKPGVELPELKLPVSGNSRTASEPTPLPPSLNTPKAPSIVTPSSQSGSYGWIGAILFAICGYFAWLFLRMRRRK